MPPPRTCEQCGEPLQRDQRRFCSRQCNGRARRITDEAEKVCGICGRTFAKPAGQKGSGWANRVYCSVACVHEARRRKAWAKRPQRQCPICGDRFRTSQPIERQATCGKPDCKSRYRREFSVPQLAATMRARYANGDRPKSSGVSLREMILWEHLRPLGWTWRLRWFDAWGCFELDFALVESRVNVEIDGREHAYRTRRVADERRDAELQRRGWRILRVSNDLVDADPDAVIAQITAFVA